MNGLFIGMNATNDGPNEDKNECFIYWNEWTIYLLNDAEKHKHDILT